MSGNRTPGNSFKVMLLVKTKNIPRAPGIYWYLRGKKVIYVGKAKNLKNRLNSYRQLTRLDNKTKLLLESATQVKFKVLTSEIEAILTESRLIKLYQPHFNLIQKDDKAPIFLTITKEIYPRILFTRGTGTFGPFTSARVLRQILERLRRVFPYCNASRKQRRACFYFHLKLCPGACVGTISPAAYQKNIRRIKLFFQNKQKRLLSAIKKDMLVLSKNQNYVQAKQLRDQLVSLSYLWQSSPRRIETYDISNLSGTNPAGAMVVAIDGKIDKSQYRLFNLRSGSVGDPALLAEVISRRLHHPEWGRPDLIVVDGSINQIQAVKRVLPKNISAIGVAKKPDRLVEIKNKTKSVRLLNLANPADKLLIRLRDEAHRFGRKQHLRLRDRALFL